MFLHYYLAVGDEGRRRPSLEINSGKSEIIRALNLSAETELSDEDVFYALIHFQQPAYNDLISKQIDCEICKLSRSYSGE